MSISLVGEWEVVPKNQNRTPFTLLSFVAFSTHNKSNKETVIKSGVQHGKLDVQVKS